MKDTLTSTKKEKSSNKQKQSKSKISSNISILVPDRINKICINIIKDIKDRKNKIKSSEISILNKNKHEHEDQSEVNKQPNITNLIKNSLHLNLSKTKSERRLFTKEKECESQLNSIANDFKNRLFKIKNNSFLQLTNKNAHVNHISNLSVSNNSNFNFEYMERSEKEKLKSIHENTYKNQKESFISSIEEKADKDKGKIKEVLDQFKISLEEISFLLVNKYYPIDYLFDIYNNLKRSTEKYFNKHNKNHLFKEVYGYIIYSNHQSNQNYSKARAILVDWMMNVSFKFGLSEETFFISISIYDRYIRKVMTESKKNIGKYLQIQKIGAASLSIACKYEEIYSPEIGDFVYITGSSFSKEEILNCEFNILQELDFQICLPTYIEQYNILCILCYSYISHMYFLKYKSMIRNEEYLEVVNFGKYCFYIYSLWIRSCQYSSTLIALSVMSIVSFSVLFILNWNENSIDSYDKVLFYSNDPLLYIPTKILDDYTDIDKNQSRKVFVEILYIINHYSQTGLSGIFEKYPKNNQKRQIDKYVKWFSTVSAGAE